MALLLTLPCLKIPDMLEGGRGTTRDTTVTNLPSHSSRRCLTEAYFQKHLHFISEVLFKAGTWVLENLFYKVLGFLILF